MDKYDYGDELGIEMEEEIMNYEEKYKQLCEALVGVDATERYSHEDIISYVFNLKNIEEKYYDSQKT